MTKVKVYSTPSCPWCIKVKEYLKGKNIPFEELDVASNEEARNHMVDLSGQMGVPVTMIDEKIIVGYNTDAIDEALDSKK